MGELDVRPGQEMDVIEYEEDLKEGQFFAVLKRRVDKYFRSNKVSHCALSCIHLRVQTIVAEQSFTQTVWIT